MTIPEIMPTELSGFCDVSTGECVVVDTGTATAAGSATDDTSTSRGPGRSASPRGAQGVRNN
jgi:hypothetical protein